MNFSFRLIVGAPKSNDSLVSGGKGKERGAVWECPISSSSSSCTLMAKADQISMLFYTYF